MCFNLKFLHSGQISCSLLIWVDSGEILKKVVSHEFFAFEFLANFGYQNNKNQLRYSCVDVSMHTCPIPSSISFCKIAPYIYQNRTFVIYILASFFPL